jgi:hypothetical protein
MGLGKRDCLLGHVMTWHLVLNAAFFLEQRIAGIRHKQIAIDLLEKTSSVREKFV